MLEPFTRDSLEDIQERVEQLSEALRLVDYDITVAFVDPENDEEGKHAEIRFTNHWVATIVLYSEFLSSDYRGQILTLIHEMLHVAHHRVDKFVEAYIGDDEALQRVYESIHEEFVEHMERALGVVMSGLSG